MTFSDAFFSWRFKGKCVKNIYDPLYFTLYEEMKDFFGFDLHIPTSDALMINELKKWLNLAASLGKC